MNKFYVKDGNLVKYFDKVSDVVLFLEQAVQLKLKITRNAWMQHLADVGYAFDKDNSGKVFVESLNDYFDIGVVQSDGRHVRCSIFEATIYNKPEYGD